MFARAWGINPHHFYDHPEALEAAKIAFHEKFISEMQNLAAGGPQEGTTLPQARHIAPAPPNVSGARFGGINTSHPHAETQTHSTNTQNFIENYSQNLSQNRGTTGMIVMTPEQLSSLIRDAAAKVPTPISEVSRGGDKRVTKGAKLPLFYGSSTSLTALDVVDWIQIAEDNMKLERVAQDDKVLYAASFLAGALLLIRAKPC